VRRSSTKTSVHLTRRQVELLQSMNTCVDKPRIIYYISRPQFYDVKNNGVNSSVIHVVRNRGRSITLNAHYQRVSAPQVAAKSKGGDDNVAGKPTSHLTTARHLSKLKTSSPLQHHSYAVLYSRSYQRTLNPKPRHSLPWVPSYFPTCALGGMSTKLS
jgi:hypothetical protein